MTRDAGWSDCTPGRFLMPGELAGSPALTFTPLPAEMRAGARWGANSPAASAPTSRGW